MRPPSRYTHFESKNAVFDAMFADAYSQLGDAYDALSPSDEPRSALLASAELYFDVAVADAARYQLMNQPALPYFQPVHCNNDLPVRPDMDECVWRVDFRGRSLISFLGRCR